MSEGASRSELSGVLAEIRDLLARVAAAQEAASTLAARDPEANRQRTSPYPVTQTATDLIGTLNALAASETELAQQRTDLARTRTDLAERRTGLVEEQTDLLHTASVLAQIRTEQSGARTYLSLIRAGLAFVTLGVILVRYFGISWWTTFDAALVLPSALAAAYGVFGYRRALRSIRLLDAHLPEDMRAALQTTRDPHI